MRAKYSFNTRIHCFALVTLATSILVACSVSGRSGAQMAGSTSRPAATVDRQTSETVVTIHDFAFGPAEIRIKAGETVRWINDDIVPHTVTSDDGLFDSGFFASAEGYSRRFDDPGAYPYHCTPHPFMVAKVIVAPASTGNSGNESEGA